MAVTRTAEMTLEAMQALATLANQKLYASPPFAFSATENNWFSEMSRIRAAAGFKLTELKIADHLQQVSGPWPVSATAHIWANNWFKDAVYYYPENGGQLVKTLGEVSGQVGSGLSLGNQDLSAPYACQNSIIKITIGGDRPCQFTTQSKIAWKIRTDNIGDPAPVPYYWTDMPGIVWQTRLVAGATEDSEVAAIAENVTVSPGTYTFIVAATTPHYLPYFGNAVVVNSCNISHTANVPEETPGLHSSRKVMKLTAPQTPPGELPFGLYWDNYGAGNPDLAATRRQSVLSWEAIPDAGGFWTCKTLPIPAVNADVWQTMWPNTPGQPLQQSLAAPSPEKVKLNATEPAIAYLPARFPFIRDTDTAPNWASSSLRGYWIWDLSVRRAPTGTIALAPETSTPLAVAIGCMRNGAFAKWYDFDLATNEKEKHRTDAAIGTPVFDAAPIRWQSSGRVVPSGQAFNTLPTFTGLAGNLGTGTPTQWWQIPMTYPICAAQYNDLEAVLNLL